MENQYAEEHRSGNLFGFFSTLSVVIGCVGIFGLCLYEANSRTRELSIRKILGASIRSLAILLTKNFMTVVVVSTAIAIPVAWWMMNKWLLSFAYKTQMNWWIFALAGACAIAIALITIGFQAIKSALANPVRSLRSE